MTRHLQPPVLNFGLKIGPNRTTIQPLSRLGADARQARVPGSHSPHLRGRRVRRKTRAATHPLLGHRVRWLIRAGHGLAVREVVLPRLGDVGSPDLLVPTDVGQAATGQRPCGVLVRLVRPVAWRATVPDPSEHFDLTIRQLWHPRHERWSITGMSTGLSGVA